MSRWGIAACVLSFFVMLIARRSWNSLVWPAQGALMSVPGEKWEAGIYCKISGNCSPAAEGDKIAPRSALRQ